MFINPDATNERESQHAEKCVVSSWSFHPSSFAEQGPTYTEGVHAIYKLLDLESPICQLKPGFCCPGVYCGSIIWHHYWHRLWVVWVPCSSTYCEIKNWYVVFRHVPTSLPLQRAYHQSRLCVDTRKNEDLDHFSIQGHSSQSSDDSSIKTISGPLLHIKTPLSLSASHTPCSPMARCRLDGQDSCRKQNCVRVRW